MSITACPASKRDDVWGGGGIAEEVVANVAAVVAAVVIVVVVVVVVVAVAVAVVVDKLLHLASAFLFDASASLASNKLLLISDNEDLSILLTIAARFVAGSRAT